MAAKTDSRKMRLRAWDTCEKIAFKLYRKFSLDFDDLITNKPEFARAEYFLHEAAHWLTLDTRRAPEDLPEKLSDVVGDEIRIFSQITRESLEFDALVVEHIAGATLDLWSFRDRRVVVRAGEQATALSRVVVSREIDKRIQRMKQMGCSDNGVLETLGYRLADWFSAQEFRG